MLVDRVGVVEGVLDDLAHGHIPNIPGELGVKAEWEHNSKMLLMGSVAGAVLLCFAATRRSGKDDF